jgi:urease accessory protein
MSVNVSPFDVKAGLPPSLRAIGAVRLLARAVEGGTEAYEVEESGPLRLRFPRLAEDALEAILINTGGGIAGGDRLEIAVEAGEGARVALPARRRRNHAPAPAARITLRSRPAPARGSTGCRGKPFCSTAPRRADLTQVAPDARLTICEASCSPHRDGRARARTWRDQASAAVAAVFADASRSMEASRKSWRSGFGRRRRRDRDPLQVAPDAETRLDALRAAFGNEIEAGASAFDGVLIARLIAPDGFMLRRALLDALTALDCAPPPAFTL